MLLKKRVLLSTGNKVIDSIVSDVIDTSVVELINVPVTSLKSSIVPDNPDLIILLDNYFAVKSLKIDKKTSSIPVVSLFLDASEKTKDVYANDVWALGDSRATLKEIIDNNLEGPDSKRRRVLLIDDDEIIHKLVKHTLQSGNYKFFDAFDGTQGMKMLDKFDPQLIITDIEMPGINGFDLCRMVKEERNQGSPPILMLSSLSTVDMLEKGFEAGTDDYITKPFTDEQLIDKVEFLLSNSKKSRTEKILLVDDSKTTVQLMVNALSPQGFKVLCAADGEEGLKIAQREIPDVIISDLEMPVMNGFDFCQNIKNGVETSEIPFIALTGKNSKGARGLGKKYGIDFFLVKPFTTEKVTVLIERFLAERRELLKLEKSMVIASITALAKALDEKDTYTRFHSENVANYASRLAQGLNLSPKETDDLRISGLLHDIGKIGIRDTVLLKPGKLTDDEYALIKGHPEKGASILKPIPSLKNIIPNILLHHERIDGMGYPQGLKGDEIPLGAKIIAVADTYDALTSNRAYRKKMEKEKAVSILRSAAGTQLCKECVDVFLMILQ